MTSTGSRGRRRTDDRCRRAAASAANDRYPFLRRSCRRAVSAAFFMILFDVVLVARTSSWKAGGMVTSSLVPSFVTASASAAASSSSSSSSSSCFVVDEHGNQVKVEDPTCRATAAAGRGGGGGGGSDVLDSKALDLGVEQVYLDHVRADERQRMEKRLERTRRYLSLLQSDPDWEQPEADAAIIKDSTTNSSSSSSTPPSFCRNVKPHCLMWSVRGECQSNPSFMNEHCAPVCFSCHAEWARRRQGSWLRERLIEIGADLGAVQLSRGPVDRDRIVKLLDDAREYLHQLDEGIDQDDGDDEESRRPVADYCYLKHHDCAHWAISGHCPKPDEATGAISSSDKDDSSLSPMQASMVRLCAPLCRACHLLKEHDDADSTVRPSTDAVVNASLGHDWGAIQNVVVIDDESLVDNDEDEGFPDLTNDNYSLDDLSALLSQVIRDRAYIEAYVKEEEALRAGQAAVARSSCRNRHEHCTAWSLEGECTANAKFMSRECPVSCQTCDRCRKDPNGTDVWGPGDLDRTFERILSDPANRKYQPRVLSRPTYAPGDTAENATYQLGMWLLLFDQLLTEDEAAELLQVVQKKEFNPSRVLSGFENSQSVNRESKARTSYQTWCTEDCETDPAHRRMVDRISNVTGIPEMNFESTQVPRYLEGQYYHRHNDCILQHEFLPCGPRILTAFVYLNHVEEGGGTTFPVLNLTAMPKPGRAVLWPSVHNDRPNTKDDRADHAALVVEKGIKYGANIWIHQRDYKTPHDNDCS